MLDLTPWQAFALLACAAITYFGGRFVGGFVHRSVYRRLLITRDRVDDQLLVRLEPPFQLAGAAFVWHLLVSFFDLTPDGLAFCRNVGHIMLLVAIGWGGMRLVDTFTERLPVGLAPVTRRIANLSIGAVIGLMVLSRVGYATGPLLVLLAIAGACLALAAHRPLENLLSAYAILGEHGVRQGDTVRLDSGITGTIEHIGLYSTRLRTSSSTTVIVPNRKLADAQIERGFQRSTTRPLGVVSGAGGS